MAFELDDDNPYAGDPDDNGSAPAASSSAAVPAASGIGILPDLLATPATPGAAPAAAPAPAATPNAPTLAPEPDYDYAGDGDEDSQTQTAAAATGDADADHPLSSLYSLLGWEKGEVTLDSETRPFHEFSPEQRREILESSYEQMYSAGQASAIETALRPNEIEVLNYMRQNGDQLPVAAAPLDTQALSADDLHRMDLQNRYKSLSADQIEDQLAILRQSPIYDEQANTLRTEFQAQQQKAIVDSQIKEHNDYASEVNTALSEIQNVHGWDWDQSTRDYVRQQLVSPKPGELAPFIQELADPKVLSEIVWLRTSFPQIIQGYEEQVRQAEQRGYARALSGAPSHPPVATTTNQARAGKLPPLTFGANPRTGK